MAGRIYLEVSAHTLSGCLLQEFVSAASVNNSKPKQTIFSFYFKNMKLQKTILSNVER